MSVSPSSQPYTFRFQADWESIPGKHHPSSMQKTDYAADCKRCHWNSTGRTIDDSHYVQVQWTKSQFMYNFWLSTACFHILSKENEICISVTTVL